MTYSQQLHEYHVNDPNIVNERYAYTTHQISLKEARWAILLTGMDSCMF